jgi:hypothetical protein
MASLVKRGLALALGEQTVCSESSPEDEAATYTTHESLPEQAITDILVLYH